MVTKFFILWRSNSKYWGAITVLLHWLTAILVIFLFILGLWMVDLNYYHSWYNKAPHIHQSIGMLLLFMIIFRIVWRVFNKVPDSLEAHSKIEKKMAYIMHMTLYILLLILLISGYFMVSADGNKINIFNWFSLPPITENFMYQADLSGKIHFYTAILLIICTILHAIAALKHHIIDKDNTLIRMVKLFKN